jgi:hypothetical protein
LTLSQKTPPKCRKADGRRFSTISKNTPRQTNGNEKKPRLRRKRKPQHRSQKWGYAAYSTGGAKAHSITPFLMFNANPEEAAKFYAKIFKNSKILSANPMQADFILNGQRFFSYNGGDHPQFQI